MNISSMTPASFGDILGFVLACITLIVTLLLVLIAIKIGADIRVIIDRVSSLEKSKTGETKETMAVRSLLEIFRRQFDINYRMVVSLAMFQILIDIDSEENFSKVLEKELEQYKQSMDRYLLYLLLLRESKGEEMRIRLSNIVSIYPDETTINFLEQTIFIFPQDSVQELERNLFALKQKVRGTESFLWTGRR